MNERDRKRVDIVFSIHDDLSECNSIDPPLFNELGSDIMVQQRLHRAVMDELEGDSIHSRYAIWASDVSRLIDEALVFVKNCKFEAAIDRLGIAMKTVKTYRDLQIVMTQETPNSAHMLFKNYAEHLLALPDDSSEVLEKDEIVRLLKVHSKTSGADLPRDIDLSIRNRVLQVHIRNATQNMQVDSAAFEAWIIVLKSLFDHEILFVVLDFDEPRHLTAKFGDSETSHYNRFLYRLNNLSALYPDWFFVRDDNWVVVEEFMHWLQSSDCLMNHSLKERTSVIGTQKMERQIESWFAFEAGKDIVCSHWKINRNRFFNQLPVGVFFEEISSKNSVFTRGASAIDLWGVGEDNRTLHMIELKCGGNKGLGVISEVLFYAAVLRDTCILPEPLFRFGRYGKSVDTADGTVIRNDGKPFDRLAVHILAERFHPLFNEAVEETIRSGLSAQGIDFDRTRYDYSKKGLIDEDHHP